MPDYQYRIVIQPLSREDGGGYLAAVPELPGCIADGATDIEALENAHDAIKSWLEAATELGRAIPAPEYERRYA